MVVGLPGKSQGSCRVRSANMENVVRAERTWLSGAREGPIRNEVDAFRVVT